MTRRALVLLVLLVFTLFTGTIALAQDETAEAPAAEAVAQEDAAPAPAASGGLITGLRHLHAWVRWAVVVLAVLALVKFIAGLVQGSAYDALANRLIRLFGMALGLQWLIGLIFFVVLGQFNVGYRWEHAITMTIAVAVVEMLTRRKSAADNVRYRNGVIAILVALVLIYIGVARLPQGWMVTPSI
ncbi:MAG: hypothetical protein DIU68_002250 [Chloroflexota bacterium]